MAETHVAARCRLMNELNALGWKTESSLKVPLAEKDGLKLAFRAKSLYLDGRLLSLDIRDLDAAGLVTYVRSVQKYQKGG
jgi:hypothetical protein